jgi:hypothetical protein
MPSIPSVLRAICDHKSKPITTLAREIRIDAASASKASQGSQNLTLGMLEGLLERGKLPSNLAGELVKAFVEDLLPAIALEKIVILVKPSWQASEESTLREDPPKDAISSDLSNLDRKARKNPALARALRNLAVALSGEHVATE